MKEVLFFKNIQGQNRFSVVTFSLLLSLFCCLSISIFSLASISNEVYRGPPTWLGSWKTSIKSTSHQRFGTFQRGMNPVKSVMVSRRIPLLSAFASLSSTSASSSSFRFLPFATAFTPSPSFCPNNEMDRTSAGSSSTTMMTNCNSKSDFRLYNSAANRMFTSSSRGGSLSTSSSSSKNLPMTNICPANSLTTTSTVTTGGSSTALSGSASTSEATKTLQPKFRSSYKQPPYWITDVDMKIQLVPENENEGGSETIAITTSSLTIKMNENTFDKTNPQKLELDGEEITLLEATINDVPLSKEDGDYELTSSGDLLIAPHVFTKYLGDGNGANNFILKTKCKSYPEKNFELSGLYKSGSCFTTQCEAEGFRRITYFYDRPDVMARFKVRLEAPKESCPVLLSNGNMIASGDMENGQHFTEWEDPFPKPAYLFAIVAGNLGSIKDKFTTKSGMKVDLAIYTEQENVHKLDYAMQSLINSMKWDEDKYGLEYDLETYNIVAVNDFNMGAMENKGLNIFNTAYVLAVPETATDKDYEGIEGVIGHEYFHNWTGNRVTCRDWFQLTLKEGLTVFRDQQFSADMGSAAVKRIEDVRALRGRQFAEDAGPRAHNIRPESYMKMDNFYTATVYEKGAQVIRMYHTLLGAEGFRKGMDLYFQRHDGSAVTCDDFRFAMADATNKDLTQFERWYLQAGTPTVTVVSKAYDNTSGLYKITLEQSCDPSVGQPTKLPFHIPVAIGLLDSQTGEEILPTTVLELTEASQTFELKIPSGKEEPIASILRDFSAPVRLKMERSEEELSFLMKYDTDSFNRWEASQTLATVGINYIVKTGVDNGGFDNKDDPMAQELGKNLIEAYRAVLVNALEDDNVDKSLLAYALTLPDTSTLLTEMVPMRPLVLNEARGYLRKYIATNLKSLFEEVFEKCTVDPKTPYVVNPKEIGRRRLRNTCLGYLCLFKDDQAVKLAKTAFDSATCMTDSLAALGCLANMDELNSEHKQIKAQALQKFHDSADGDPLVLNKWFSIQATADYKAGDSSKSVVESIKQLMDTHPKFSLKNPNVVRALVGAFANSNIAHFHAEDGSGYELVGKAVRDLDKLNGLVAARLAGVFSSWRKMEQGRSILMKQELEKIIAMEGLSKDTYEIVSLSLYAK